MSRDDKREVYAYIERVIKTSDEKYDLYIRLFVKNKDYLMYIPRLARKPEEIKLSRESRDRLLITVISKGEGFCTCTLDLNKISEGCIQLRCLSPIGIWISDEELLKRHKISEM